MVQQAPNCGFPAAILMLTCTTAGIIIADLQVLKPGKHLVRDVRGSHVFQAELDSGADS